jgi:hypothetical protein
LDEKITQALSLAVFIKSNPMGLNYAFLWRGVGTDRVSRLVYCPAGFAFSRLTNTIARSGILGI